MDVVTQAAMRRHFSQSIGAGAFDGQQGMSSAISPVVAEPDVSSAIPGIDTSDDVVAMTGRDSGANTSPAIIKIASSRRMVIERFTPRKSHKCAKIESLPS